MNHDQRIEMQFEARDLRRLKAEDRYLSRLEMREAAAEPLVGELCRDGLIIPYINVRNAKGVPTGKTREFPGPTGFGQAISFLIRNNYV
ncbi:MULTISPECIES: hypothetical protein [unclassified Xanthobacter]|uniref:hypothetical protein n=1 Tax=unclassified Xanthobacter TaxID=2623496 RepID=UPI001F26DBAC|nr:MULTISPECIES: hypothetical protein [unclassified Xanthobacter]